MTENEKLIIYGGEGCQKCEVIKMMLDDKGIPYTYIDIYNDEQAQNHLTNKVGDFIVPKMEYGENIVNYSAKNMEKLIKDFVEI